MNRSAHRSASPPPPRAVTLIRAPLVAITAVVTTCHKTLNLGEAMPPPHRDTRGIRRLRSAHEADNHKLLQPDRAARAVRRMCGANDAEAHELRQPSEPPRSPGDGGRMAMACVDRLTLAPSSTVACAHGNAVAAAKAADNKI